MKKTVLGVMIGLLLGTGITVLAATLMANDVTYTPSNSKWKVNNVGSALDDLYTNAKVSLNKFCELKSGDALTVGSMYECDPGDGVKRNFYVLEVRNNEVDLIMNRNLTDSIGDRTISWINAVSFFEKGKAGYEVSQSWSNIISIDLPSAQQIANAVNYDWNSYTSDPTWWCFASHKQDSQSVPYCNAESLKEYIWLFDYSNDCTIYGCSNSLDSSYASGYWTKTLVKSKQYGWSVQRNGSLAGHFESTNRGVRPVITVLKSNLS